MENKKNSVYTDILIIISVLAVVAVSVILKKWFKAEVASISWFFMTTLQSIFRFAIPTIIYGFRCQNALIAGQLKHQNGFL